MAEDARFLPKAEVLSLEELARLSGVFIKLGVRKLRLTGGEPLMRHGFMQLVGALGGHVAAGRLHELTLTTNGSQLSQYARGLVEAGIKRINVSLDSLDPELFQRLTRRGKVEAVLEGIRAAKAAGLEIKINTVVLGRVNSHEIDRLIAWCGDEGYDLSLIEAMPLGQFSTGLEAQAIPLNALREQLAQRWTLTPTSYQSGGPARYVTIAETGQRLGFITPLSHGFCESCNRVRVSCTGQLFLCLGQETYTDLRQLLRESADDAPVERAIRAAMGGKPEEHDFVARRANHAPLQRTMNHTGG
jgi:cyclic pyranopterin phosphate synthase